MPMTKAKYKLTKKEEQDGRNWVLYIATSMEFINQTCKDIFEVVGQLNQHSDKHRLQIKAIRKKLISMHKQIEKMETRIKTLENARSRFDGVTDAG
jgi:hypothetical protein